MLKILLLFVGIGIFAAEGDKNYDFLYEKDDSKVFFSNFTNHKYEETKQQVQKLVDNYKDSINGNSLTPLVKSIKFPAKLDNTKAVSMFMDQSINFFTYLDIVNEVINEFFDSKKVKIDSVIDIKKAKKLYHDRSLVWYQLNKLALLCRSNKKDTARQIYLSLKPLNSYISFDKVYSFALNNDNHQVYEFFYTQCFPFVNKSSGEPSEWLKKLNNLSQSMYLIESLLWDKREALVKKYHEEVEQIEIIRVTHCQNVKQETLDSLIKHISYEHEYIDNSINSLNTALKKLCSEMNIEKLWCRRSHISKILGEEDSLLTFNAGNWLRKQNNAIFITGNSQPLPKAVLNETGSAAYPKAWRRVDASIRRIGVLQVFEEIAPKVLERYKKLKSKITPKDLAYFYLRNTTPLTLIGEKTVDISLGTTKND